MDEYNVLTLFNRKKVRECFVVGNDLSGLEDESFQHLHNLRSLSLAYNNLTQDYSGVSLLLESNAFVKSKLCNVLFVV